MTDHGPHCTTCTCGCTCGFGGQHDDQNPRCALNQEPEGAFVLCNCGLWSTEHVRTPAGNGWAGCPGA